MPYLHEETLRDRAEKYILALVKAGIKSKITMVRDYSIKLSIEKENKKYGNLIINYKASKNTFSIRTQELQDKTIEDDLFDLWEKDKLSYSMTKAKTCSGSCHGLCEAYDTKNIDDAANKEDIYEIYVDGSFINEYVGYGVAILKNGNLIEELSGCVTDSTFTSARQVGGEITAVMEALLWCQKKNIQKASIFYDFENLKKWVTGEYSANTTMSRIYRDFVRNLEIEIQWNKVLGHSGDRWNERADALAKNGAINNIVECKSSSRDIELKNSVSIIEELEEAAEDFAVFLESNGYIAEYLHIENNMAAKICVEKEGQTVGYVNIYNTSKLHLQPRYHEIKQIEARKEIEELYNIFMLNYHLEL